MCKLQVTPAGDSFKRKHLGTGKRKVGGINGRVETGCASRKTDDEGKPDVKFPLFWLL